MATITVICPKCGAQLRTDEGHLGKKGRCRSCGEKFVIEIDEQKVSTAADALEELAAAAEAGDEEEGNGRPSMVLLLRRPKVLNEDTLRETAGRALGVVFEKHEDAAEFVVGESPMFIVKLRDHIFMVNNFDQPYIDLPPEEAGEIDDAELREVVAAHRAWLSVDRMICPDDADDRYAYQVIGKLIAALADEDAMAVYLVPEGALAAYRPEFRAILRSPDPLEIFYRLKKPLISVEMLLRRQVDLDFQMLRRAANSAFGVELPDSPNVAKCTVVEKDILVQVKDFSILVSERPHIDYEKTGKGSPIPDPNLRQAVEAHRACVGLEMFGKPEHADMAQACRMIGKFAVNLAGPECLAIYLPDTEQWHVYNDALEGRLTGHEAASTLTEGYRVPLINVDDDDSAMKTAVAEARRRWPEFVEAFDCRDEEQVFIVKAPFADGENTEFMWLKVTEIQDEVIHGELSNAPMDLETLKMGDSVQVRLEDLNDWSYGRGGPEVGGFTLKVLEDAQKRQAQ